jgi:hypothetical protein
MLLVCHVLLQMPLPKVGTGAVFACGYLLARMLFLEQISGLCLPRPRRLQTLHLQTLRLIGT